MDEASSSSTHDECTAGDTSGITRRDKSEKKRKRKYRKKSKSVTKSEESETLLENRHDQKDVSENVNINDYNSSILQNEMKVLDIQEENIRYTTVDSNDYHGILILGKNQVVALKGFMSFNVLYGEVDVSGYKMVAGQKFFPDVFSATTSSLFYIKGTTLTPCSIETKEQLIKDLSVILQTINNNITKLLNVEELYACVVVKKLYSLLPPLLKKFNGFKGLPLTPKFLPRSFHTSVLKTDHWSELMQAIQLDMTSNNDCSCSLMICGAPNVGKSSFVRYSINRLLEKYEYVYCLDCDCGQSEFTPPSVLSLIKVTKPLIGLPFSHQVTPISSYFYGHISPGGSPSEYIKLIHLLFETFRKKYHRRKRPLLINTQGWIQGLGLSLLTDCIRILSPCHVVYISGPTKKSNVPKYLDKEVLENKRGWSVDPSYQSVKRIHECKYHNISTTDIQQQFSTGNKSRMAREQCITSYFSRLYEPYMQRALANGERYESWIPSSLSIIEPRVIRWKDVALHVMHEKVTLDVLLFSFNLALVCLAHVDPDIIADSSPSHDNPNFLLNQPVAECIGFGIVRNIDVDDKLFYILTPEPMERLKCVNALLRGSAQLPNTYFVDNAQNNQPYYCSDYINVASKTAGGIKPRYNLKRKPSKIRSTKE